MQFLLRFVLFALALALPASLADAQTPNSNYQVNGGNVSVGTSATLIVKANQNRKGVILIQEGTTPVRLGNSSVTTSNGALLSGTAGTAITVYGGGAVYGVVGTGTQAVSFIEMF